MSKSLLVSMAQTLLILSATAAVSEEVVPNPCQPQIDALNSAANAVTEKFKPQLEQLSVDAKTRADQIKDDAPDPSVVGAVLKFDIKVTSHEEEFVFGLPSATMRTQTVSFDLPEVSSHRVEWSWDLPEPTMEMACVPGIPETVCDPGEAPSCHMDGLSITCSGGRAPSCSVRSGPELCTQVPGFRMVTQTSSIDVPEVAMKTQEMKFDLPEFEIVQQRIVLTIPDFTLVNVTAAQKKTQDDSTELQAQTKTQSEEISRQMQLELKSTMSEKVTDVFACNEGQLSSQRDTTLAKLDGQINEMTAKAQAARDGKNDAVAAAIDTTVATMVATRAQVVEQFAKAIADLRKSLDAALAGSAG